MKKAIEVVPYNSKWQVLFELEAQALKSILKDNVSAIHHVGSTSIPGLASKPIIDIIVVVKDSSNVSLDGYVYKGEYNIPFRKFFNKEGVNLHLYEDNHPEIELNLTFRDYLRTHPEARDAYAKIKHDLLKDPASFEKKNTFSGYTLGKDRFIKECLKKAGFNTIRLIRAFHYEDLEFARQYVDEETLNHPDLAHFILCKGVDPIGYGHVDLKKKTIDCKAPDAHAEYFHTILKKWLFIAR